MHRTALIPATNRNINSAETKSHMTHFFFFFFTMKAAVYH